MKQLYCMSGDRGDSGTNHGEPGVRIRAASAGVASDRMQAVLHYAGYASPARGASPAVEPPARLALLQTADAGRFLCHSTCLGIDPATGQNGKFFSHVLLDVPAAFDAQQAIQSWGSPLWQRADQGGVQLPEALYLPVSATLDDKELAQFLDQPAHRELLQFVLAALLTTTPQTRIFVAAPAEVVARCVYGLTRALPPSLLEGFTFSTYERDPQQCPARLVGTCGEDPKRDLLAACAARGDVAYDSDTRSHSELPSEPPFVAFAVTALAERRTAALDEFHGTWQRLGIKEAGLFELVYRLGRGSGTLTKEESQQVLHHPTLCSWVAARPDALGQFLEWALEDQAYATATFSRAVAALRQQPERLARLAQAVQERGLAALREGDLIRTRNALEALMPMVAPARSSAVWSELLGGIADPEQLPWEMRCYLLPRLARLWGVSGGSPSGVSHGSPPSGPLTPDGGLQRWLDVSAERLAALLALDLPQTWRQAACLACLRREGEPSAEFARTLAAHPALVLTALQQPADTEGEIRAVALFQGVLTEAPGHPWAEELVRHGRSLSRTLLDRCLYVALENGHTAAADLVAAGHGPALLELLADRPTLDRVAAQLLSRPADNLRTDHGRGEFLQALMASAGLTPEVRGRLEACLGVQAFLAQPVLERQVLDRVAAALRLEPPLFSLEIRDGAVAAVAAELARRGGEEVQGNLETVLLALGPTWPGGPSALFRALLRDRHGQRASWKQPDLLHAFLAVALGAPQAAELAGLLDNLDADAYALAQQAASRGGAKVLTAIDRRTAQWPPATRSQWGFLARAVQPRGVRQLARETALFVAGLLVGGVGVLGLRWFGVLQLGGTDSLTLAIIDYLFAKFGNWQ